MSNPKIKDLSANSPYLEEVYEKYKKRFAQPPWSEVSKCKDGFSDQLVDSHCKKCD
mgnify:CR=1 FL=1